ncbi:MAG TPA: FtsX-like permease family protein, partial [Longimicrobiales bacterium]|nr:FtsX-like permease family protein [Longimicrobiales bacterium]
NAVMFAEVTLALAVLIVAGTFLQKFRATQVAETGFQRAGVLLAQYDLSMRNVEPAPARDFTARLLEGLRALPGVEGAAVALSVPLDIHGLAVGSFILEGRPRDDASRNIALTNVVTPGYFEALGIPFKGGRDFADLNDGNAVPQAIVNEAFIRRFFLDEAGAVGGGGGLARRLHGSAAPPARAPGSQPHQPHGVRVEAIGRAVEIGGTQYIITGVVENSLYESFAEPPTPIIYLSYRDRPMSNGQIHLRTRPGQEYALTSEVRRVVRQLDASLPLFDVRTMNQHVERNLFFERVPARMFAVLGPLLLVLAAIGIYAVVAFTVARRTAEIGLRLALGATARKVIAQVMRENLRVVGYGVLAGCFLILLIYMHLPGTEPPGLPIFLGVPGLLLLVAAVACWLPARRVTRVDPTVALRQD